MSRWWDRERRIRNLKVQLDAKSGELHDAHRMLQERENERTALVRHLQIMREKAHQAEAKLHLAEAVKAEQLDELIAAGRTIQELQAALDLAVKGHQHG